jgi:hypothetical protein
MQLQRQLIRSQGRRRDFLRTERHKLMMASVMTRTNERLYADD